MASTQQLAADPAKSMNGPEQKSSGQQRYRHYLLWSLLVPAVLWIAAFPLVCSRSYEQWGETQWGPVLEFPYVSGTPDADVVIFGDSSAFLGINPRLINAQLGIHSVVLPSTVGSLPVTGDAPLRSYLAHHRRPRLIVLYFSAWNLDFGHTAPGRLFEGEEMMMRHGSAGEIARYELRHPLELAAFPLRLYSTFGPKMITAVLHGANRAADTTAELGHVPYLEPFPGLSNLCRIPAEYLRPKGDASVRELYERYRAQGMQVMVYLAPVPRCLNSSASRKLAYPDLHTAPPATLAPTDFAADPYYAHIWPFAVPQATALFAAKLHAELQR